MKGNEAVGKTFQKGKKSKQFQGSGIKPKGNFVKKGDVLLRHGVKPTRGFHEVKLRKVET